jgi:3-methylcrotonyl-CoA carboxylase alpha subunit
VIKSLLIANRGEIACRIIRTAHAMGIRTVAVYSDADAKALHVRQADEAVHIGASPARESYLVGEKIIAAAIRTGAEAIHPGYGFLSENAEFAQSVIDAGLIWVGPRPASITAMGLKDAAKKLMAEAGVPVTPGYMGENQEPAFLAERAAEIGYPVLIKAVAGGGGKGMRKVKDAADFAHALVSCQREAASSFGNDHVLIEKYIQRPRHIEVQVFGDTHGNIVHLFERDCSLQRRHQKVIEEAPAPSMDEATREQLCATAVRAAKAVDYVGAGTIEFIADASEGLRADRIWFMEMNTRLQVEHPVTEEITGVDLVEWQLLVASGEPLPMKQEELRINGHAIEARLYAEDPSNNFLPTSGEVSFLPYNGFRVETGYLGGAVPPYYDPMIAKLVLHDRNRDIVIAQFSSLLRKQIIGPITTNAQFLFRSIEHPEFGAGNVDTGFIERHHNDLIMRSLPSQSACNLAAQYFSGIETNPGEAISAKGIWHKLTGFRNNRSKQDSLSLLVDDQMVSGALFGKFTSENWTNSYFDGETAFIPENGHTFKFTNGGIRGSASGTISDGTILSPMPGRIISVMVSAGDPVTKGQKLLTLEAMKMEHSLTAPFDGVVTELNAEAGAQVQVEALLARIEKDAE